MNAAEITALATAIAALLGALGTFLAQIGLTQKHLRLQDQVDKQQSGTSDKPAGP